MTARVLVVDDLVANVRLLEASIGRVDAIGGTALRDALDVAQRYLSEHATRERKVLLVITDGLNNGSVVTRGQIEKQAAERDTVIFAVGLFGDAERSKQGRRELDAPADQTGGRAYHPARRCDRRRRARGRTPDSGISTRSRTRRSRTRPESLSGRAPPSPSGSPPSAESAVVPHLG